MISAHDPRDPASKRHRSLQEHEADHIERIELARLRKRSGLERGVRYVASGLGIGLGVLLLVASIPPVAPLGIALGVVAITFGVLQWRST